MTTKLISFIRVVLLAGATFACAASLEEDFNNPPGDAQPYVWWHWMGSNISKEGITKDLEAMNATKGQVICRASQSGIGRPACGFRKRPQAPLQGAGGVLRTLPRGQQGDRLFVCATIKGPWGRR
jgi:hypothetical protein